MLQSVQPVLQRQAELTKDWTFKQCVYKDAEGDLGSRC